MASARFAWGIDVGNRALKAVKLVRADGALKIDDFEVIEHENVLSNAGDNKEALIQSALSNFVQRHATKGGVAAVSVSGVSSFARFIKLPPVEPKKIPEIVRFEAIQQIPFPLDDVEWSYQLFQSPESPDVEVGIFAMRRELINAHIKHFTDVDLNVQVVQMNPLAVYNAMYHDNKLQDGTTMIIDLGAENTDLIIAEGETIWLRSIPIGGNNFTEVLVKSFKLPFNKAEDLKRNANTSKYARQIFQAMRPVFADLVAEIQRSIGFYSSVHRDSRIKKIIALGGAFRLAGLQKYLQQNLQLDVEKLNDFAGGAPADAKLAATFNQSLLSLASAYGLAIQAMDQAKITSSLLPMKIRREKMWRDKTKWFAGAAAVFLAGAGVAFAGYYTRDLAFKANAEIRDGQIAPTLASATALSTNWNNTVNNGASDRMTIQNVRSMLDDRATWVDLLGQIFGALPPIPAGYPGDAYLKSHPRDQREIIVLDKFDSAYAPDLLAALANAPPELGLQTAPGATGGTTISDPAIPPGSRGFIITLNVTTPHAQGFQYVLSSLIPNLRKNDQAAMTKWNADNKDTPHNFYIAKVSVPIAQQQIKDDSAKLQLLQSSYQAIQMLQGGKSGEGAQPGNIAPPPMNFAPRGMLGIPSSPMGRYGGPPQGYLAPMPNPAGVPAATGGDTAMFLDRLTQEDCRNDWEMKVMLVVVVDPAPPAPGTPGAPAQ
jgi:type IV pilus assembly protein PilM